MDSLEMGIYRINNEELARIQRIELEMLLEIDRICKKHDISYELDGGTLLGAVRHKGYIPWDDDIDIRMLRDDYDRFCRVCKRELNKKKYYLQTYYTDPEYRFGYGKLVRKGTVFTRYQHEMLKYHKGLFLDIMPCDNLPDEPVRKAVFNLKSFIIRKISYSPIGAKYETNPLYKTVYRLLQHIPVFVIRREFDRLAYQYNDQKTRLVRTPGWHHKQESWGYLRRWMDETCELEFEGHLFPAPADWDGYLRQLYGDDYMTLPPEEERIPGTYVTHLDLGNC